ncbi:spermidine synthase family protein [Nocardiopsis suaedae]|uniref:Spermidine synthase n=1 Tax=Nocardiopsis suaedae TaxID=3018444 RepID=A0ABT4TNU4_9ACTN|nr:spermidine synthase [Nocardiopsis suaedae]MDA2805797.1 spermidine synthase [Nocardiopsis suaedae]
MSLPGEDPGAPAVVERVVGETGGELVLRRTQAHWEVFSNGVFLMDTRDGASEREMVRAALGGLPGGHRGARVLIGGLGVGFSAREALDDPRVGLVRVVELEPKVVEWHSGPLGEVAGRLPEEHRCDLVRADLADWLEEAARSAAAGGERYDAVCLDTDNGPDWTVREENGRLYGARALDLLASVTAPGGAVAFWSAMRSPAFEDLLRGRFGGVRTVEVPARAGGPDLVYLVRVPA